MIGIIDCDIGNIGSLLNAFRYLNVSTEIIRDPVDLAHCDAVILPGVGAFDTAVSAVRAAGFEPAIRNFTKSGRPLLGICVGMQILTERSEEGSLPGLELVQGGMRNLKNLGCTGKVPHVGFNSIQSVNSPSEFLSDIIGKDFYFVHSYGLPTSEAEGAVATVEYGGARFVAAFQHRNIFGTQFHPEKSGEAGLLVLRRFASCSKNA